MANEIKVQTHRGKNVATGEWMDWDFDEVMVNGMRVAFVPHVENATMRLLRPLTEPTIAEIHAEVVKQRAEQGKPSVTASVARLPDPDQIRAAAKQLKKGA